MITVPSALRTIAEADALEVDLSAFPGLLDVQLDGQPVTATLDILASSGVHLRHTCQIATRIERPMTRFISWE